MATVTLFVCPSGATHVRTVALASDQYATCDNGQGSWQQVVIAEPFDPATLSQPELAGAFSAGFIVMATGLVIVWSARQIIRSVRGALG